ncbi:MAG: hypothetical protein IJK81_00390 [Selenomonadaceae bacterium]|nr:hypothetical protein [Selenomonadaceae bacterium]
MLGQINLENFVGLMSMPQKPQSAWDAVFSELVGATYKPLIYVGDQLVHGVNYFYIAEQTLITNPPVRRLVKLAINEFDGYYKLVGVQEI